MARTHRSLEGKEVTYKYPSGNTKIGIVTGCNRSIGITIQNRENLDNYLLCLNGPSSPIWKRKPTTKIRLDEYNRLFNAIINQIIEGVYIVGTVDSIITTTRIPSINTCPFSQ